MYENVLSGQFYPRNPQKYIGDHTKIFYRSSWEAKCMSYFDREESIIAWASEEVVIPYLSPVDGKKHRYFPDFLVKSKTKDGKLATMLIEVKPKKQVEQPKKKKRVTKQYISEVSTWGINQAKWKAAREHCADRGWQFMIWSEEHLGISTK